jgi:hypothetical protein
MGPCVVSGHDGTSDDATRRQVAVTSRNRYHDIGMSSRSSRVGRASSLDMVCLLSRNPPWGGEHSGLRSGEGLDPPLENFSKSRTLCRGAGSGGAPLPATMLRRLAWGADRATSQCMLACPMEAGLGVEDSAGLPSLPDAASNVIFDCYILVTYRLTLDAFCKKFVAIEGPWCNSSCAVVA